MKLKDIEVGGRYLAKVSQSLSVVRVVEIKQIPPSSWAARDAWRTIIRAVNEHTGREVTIMSPQRLRSRVEPGCEFCRQSANRTVEGFICPHCRHVWPGGESQP